MYLIFDTETTGLPKSWSAPITDTDNWPRCIQIAWQLHDEMGNLIEHQDYLVKPEGFNIPYDAERIHGISTELAEEQGISLREVLEKFNIALSKTKFVVGQNLAFDLNIMGCEFYRMGMSSQMSELPVLDTCTEITAELLKIPGGRGGKYKLPTLTELHTYLFGVPFGEAHNATADVEATTRCFLELIKKGVFSKDELQCDDTYIQRYVQTNPEPFPLIGLEHINLKKASEEVHQRLSKLQTGISDVISDEERKRFNVARFGHLHVHTQFSVLQSTIAVPKLVAKSAELNLSAVAMTDHGNMMGAFHFVMEVNDHNKRIADQNKEREEKGEGLLPLLKPIVGCEFFICEDHTDKTKKDNGYQVVLLAKNKKGYHNLAKMASIAYTDGFYYVPRIDKEVVQKYKEDIMVLTGNLYGEVPGKILNVGEKQAEEALLWWKEEFGEDLYIEIMRHGQEDENRVNKVLVDFSRKHEVKLIATNNAYYLDKKDANAHDILLCVKDGEKQSTPIGRGRGYRYGLPNQEYYFKSTEEMKNLFEDLPDAVYNIQEIVDKVEPFVLHRDVLLPKFDIPEQFQDARDLEGDGKGKRGENNFLRHLTYEGARRRYPEVTQDITERLDFELETIERTGYPGYFLIVQDFIAAAREMGVSVGPGRGSAAGSAVAYCLGITNLDPIEYDLLFERFLNPDRVSMPDIDIDFDDEGRSKVMDYVIDKYGANQVAQIITYGKMATKSAIRDTARVLDLPLFEADRIAKLIPGAMPSKWNLARFLSEEENAVKAVLRSEEFDKVKELIALSQEGSLAAETIQQAKVLEGSMRNTGIHACGVIITPDDITKFVPVTLAKDSDLYVTQFDNSVAESAGLLKMDFLGLKTLTLIKDTIKLVKYRTGIEIDPDKIPIDDVKTYELFQRGETVGVFQYESPGMQKHMRDLKPTVFGDLIAMNALYRPGPLEYIPSFINRKNGKEPIVYDLDACEEYLQETYGITVYQEQVMLLSQKLAGFTKGEADVLRKAMGKKQKAVLDKMKPKFVEQASAKGHDATTLEKIWKDWEAFASYAFNKSHSTCYAWIAYQTAFLKAHYPAEYMAAVLSNNMNDIKQVTFFMEECKRMGLHVLGPDVNESFYKFTVNDEYAIRFGMGAIKGVGQGAVKTIVENREKGDYKSIFDLAKRIDLRAANKKAFENLALAGGFDCFAGTHRAQYFYTDVTDSVPFLEKAIRYGAKTQENENSSQISLFGDSAEVDIPEPMLPMCEEWTTMEKLAKEKEVVGIYISGHPLDDFKFELKYFCTNSVGELKNLHALTGRVVTFGGMISNVEFRTSAKGKDWAMFTIEGYDEGCDFRMFNEEFLKFRHFLLQNTFVQVKVLVKEGWTNRETGQKGDPRLEFQEMKLLYEVIPTGAKKLVLLLNVNDLTHQMVNGMERIFETYSGDKPVYFDLVELERIVVQKEIVEDFSKPVVEMEGDIDMEHGEDFDLNMEIEMKETVEEIRVVNRIEMSTRKVSVDITAELLEELEKLQVNFKLN
ncbi:DNA polymerase III subunit alpha [Myroides pelagicus]|uniref:DNA polymerase III subunit alpha n=1 Tax=Myroides pelagicus TaxID=270914 RepID=UPI002DBAAA0D|nr:DNA polymerase III subunit alpha [Myroides pelagicus]MEC4113041.1 DNA polymerase III subunit alpha [Myroides pelagicus]